MSTAWIEGDNLVIIVGETRIKADRIEIEAAPMQPGTLLMAYSAEGIEAVYLAKRGEKCNKHTVQYTVTRSAGGEPQ